MSTFSEFRHLKRGDPLYSPQTQSKVCITFENSPASQMFGGGYVNTLLFIYITSSKHTCGPIRTSVISQLFYKRK